MKRFLCQTVVVNAVTLFASLVWLHDDAAACTPPPAEGRWQSGTGSGGPGTAIVATFYCSDCTAEPGFDWIVEDPNGNRVEGTVIKAEFDDSFGIVAWRPATPLIGGELYSVELTSSTGNYAGAGRASYRVTSTAPDVPPVEPDQFSATARLEFAGDITCCGEQSLACVGTVEKCFTWPDKVTRRVLLHLTWFESDEYKNQFLTSGTFSTSKERVAIEPYLSNDLSAEVAATDADDEYCYDVTAEHLFTGKTTHISGCIPADRVELFEGTDVIAEQREFILNECTEPPRDHEAEWCDVHPDECAAEGCSIQPIANRVPRWTLVGLAIGALGLARRTQRNRR